ncbi:hypothetical protein [uncultured Ruegeria sp.]|uniref:hypothetical protein n=1 Tax=uncultured Ruegeria sp. TaxID=259304 RepID=UPI0026286D8A|nr:hypothetical protein [uncultured Ruegeria sp.]
MKKVADTIQLRGRYHVKIAIPESIRGHWAGKDVYQKSTRSTDPVAAAKEARRIRAIMDAQLEQAKAEEGWRALARHLPSDQKALLDNAGGLSGLLKEYERDKKALAFIEAGKPADAGEFDIEDGPDGSPRKVVIDHFADPEELQMQQAEHSAASAAIRAQTNARGRALRQIGQDVDLVGDEFSLRDVIVKWAPTVDPQTADAARYYVRRFIELNGEIAVTELTKAHLRDYAEAIKGLPVITSGKVSDGRFVRDLPFLEAVAWAKKNNKSTLSDQTRDKYVSMMKALLAFSAGQGYRSENPWRDYSIPKDKRKHSASKKESRRPFTPAELQTILDAVWVSDNPQYGPTTIDRWAPTISTYHGTRVQEVCQLRLCDFQDLDGIWSMQITDEGTWMRAKSMATVRWVPVHPRLVELGLKQVIESRAAVEPSEAWAFPEWGRYTKKLEEMTPDKRGRVSGNYGKRFGHLRREQLKIVGRKVSHHSFRHRLQDASDNVGIPDSHRRYLTGRANKDAVESGYGDGAAMPYLYESLKLVDPLAP